MGSLFGNFEITKDLRVIAGLRKQVEILITKEERAGSFLEKPAFADETVSLYGDIAMIGKAISHYKIAEKTGQGGMGIVHLANDTLLGRKVAVKFLPDSLKIESTFGVPIARGRAPCCRTYLA